MPDSGGKKRAVRDNVIGRKDRRPRGPYRLAPSEPSRDIRRRVQLITLRRTPRPFHHVEKQCRGCAVRARRSAHSRRSHKGTTTDPVELSPPAQDPSGRGGGEQMGPPVRIRAIGGRIHTAPDSWRTKHRVGGGTARPRDRTSGGADAQRDGRTMRTRTSGKGRVG